MLRASNVIKEGEMNQIPFLQRIKKTTKCLRCTKRFDAKISVCPHCENLKDGRELEQFKEQHQNELSGATDLGRYFIIITLLIGCLLLLAQQ